MREAIALTLLTFVLVGPSLAPAVSAHAAPEPLANSEHLLADEAEDAFYFYDGYDVYNLFARQAYLETADEMGVVFRFTLYGGHAPRGQADAMNIDIGATTEDGEQTLRIGTEDDETWEGDMTIFAKNVTSTEPPSPWSTGVTARMQVFASYDQLGVGEGGSIENVWMAARADEDLRDRAPGGIYVPNSGGEAEVPLESEGRLVDSLTMDGPHGYVDVTTETDGDVVTVNVENVLENGQHIYLRPQATPGWNVSAIGESQTSLKSSSTTSFQVKATPTTEASEPLELRVVTDLGGLETVYVGANGTSSDATLEPASEASGADVDVAEPAPNESPGLGLAAVALVLAGLAVARRE
jgi:hypothetical protein